MNISKVIKQDTINGVFISTIMLNPWFYPDYHYETMVQYYDDRPTEMFRCDYYAQALLNHAQQVERFS